MLVYHSNRLEFLAKDLANLIATEPADPLIPERIVVPHPTMGRWLQLELARALGIAANMKFELPAEFAWSVLREAVPSLSKGQGFDPGNLRWHLFELLPEFSRQADAAAVRQFLADGDELKRFELADKLARIFDRCVNFRGDWILDWEQGKTPHWQARLWRLLAEKVPEQHWVHALGTFGREVSRGNAPRNWPRRVFVFAVSALSPSYLRLLGQLGESIELHIFLLNPCQEYWGDIITKRGIFYQTRNKSPDSQHFEEGNSLLAAWGRGGRDTFDALIGSGEASDSFTDPGDRSRLAMVQQDILALRTAAAGAEIKTGPTDDSLQIHCCHSAMREAEALHDRLLNLLETHPDIEPADILILTPNPARYGPAIAAVFESEGRIPVALSRFQTADSPTARAFFDLLSLPGTRFGVEAMLAPLDAPSLRARFGIEESSLTAIRDWVKQAGIRRNLASEGDTAPAMPGNTWQDGFNRLLMGYAAGDTDELSLEIAPCSIRGEGGFEAGEDDYSTLGRFISYCKAVFGLADRLSRPGNVQHWKFLLRQTLIRCFDDGSTPGAYGGIDGMRKAADEFGEVMMLIENFAEQAGRIDCPISFELVRKALKEAAARPSLAPARLADSATVGRLAPGQILPAKVICAVGMNDAGFPRNPSRHTFDPIERNERRPGDRDERYEDRFAFLEALLAARAAFLVSYTGRNQRDDSEIPPSVVVDELHDYLLDRFPDTLSAGKNESDKAAMQDSFRSEHPLQAFSKRYFKGDDELFSYSSTMLDAARILRGNGDRFLNRFAQPLPEPDVSRRKISVDELVRFFADPAGGLLRERFAIRLREEDESIEEVEPLQLDGYQKWSLRSEILARTDENRDGKVAVELVRARLLANGMLPYGGFGALACDEAFAAIDQLREALLPHAETLAVEPRHVDLDIGGFRLMGAIPNIGPQHMLWWRNGKQRPIDLIHIRLRQLAWMAAGNPPLPMTAVWLDDKRGFVEREFPAPDPELEAIDHWLGAWWRGLSRPIRFYPKSTVAYAREFGKKGGKAEDAIKKAQEAWREEPYGGREAECEQSANRLVWDLGEEKDPLNEEFCRLAELLLAPMFGIKPE